MYGFYSFWDGPGLRAGVGAADFLHVRHPIPQSRFASVGGCKPRSRPCGLLANQGRAAVSRSIGPAGVGGSPAVVRVVGESGWGGGVPVCRVSRVSRVSRVRRFARGRAGCWQIRVGRRCPGLSDLPGSEARPRPCGLLANQEGGCPGLPKTRGACLFVRQSGGQLDADTGVGRPESGGADECRVRLRPDARPAGICVGQSTEPRRRFAGKGCLLRVRALCRACCPQKMKGAPKGSLPHQKLTLKNYPLFGRPP